MTYMLTRVRPADLRRFDYIDLAALPFADEYGHDDLIHYEYGVVEAVERETPDCTFVHTNISSFGITPNFELTKMVPLS